MDWDRYKRLADTPGIWTRWMLEQTLELLQHPELTNGQSIDLPTLDVITRCLQSSPIPRPLDHKGGGVADMFKLELTADQVRRLLELVQEAQDRGVTTSGTARRGLGGFAEAWQEYLASLDGPTQPC